MCESDRLDNGNLRAAFYRRFGEAGDVLEVGEVDKPVPAEGEVCVRIVVSAVNPTGRHGWEVGR